MPRGRWFSLGWLGIAVLASGAQVAQAQTAANPLKVKPVLELFTSQGCSSCPPADALIKSYVDGHKVIALSMPVDYWDYLGWKDSLASPKFSERQRAYAKTRGDNQVYTPQVVVNGVTHVNGSHKRDIDQAILETEKKLRALQVPLRAWIDGDTLKVEAGNVASGATVNEATLWLAVMKPEVEVAIRRGENSGRKVTYSNVVSDWSQLGTWTGRKVVFERDVKTMSKSATCAVLLQVGKSGPIIGAAEIESGREAAAN